MFKLFSKMPPRVQAIVLLTIIYLGFISLGLPDTSLSITWSYIHKDLNIPIDYAGYLVMALTFCSAISSFCSGSILRRFGTGRLLVICGAITGLALLSYGFAPSFWFLLLLSLPLGFGQGAIDTGMNYYVAKHYTSRDMNWLHGFWAVGATLGPALVISIIANGGTWRLGYFTIGSIQLLLALLFLLSLGLWEASKDKDSGTVEQVQNQAAVVKRDARFWCCSLLFFLYVGCETGTGLWVYIFLKDARGFSPELAGFSVTLFWGMLMAGRFLIGFIANHLGNSRQVFFSLLLTIVAAVLLMIPGAHILTVLTLGLLGFALAPFYPAMMHAAPERFDDVTASSLIGYQGGAAMLGALALPPAIGFLAARLSFEIIPYALLLFAVLMLALLFKVDGFKTLLRRR